MVARFDKVNEVFRARLGFAPTTGQVGVPLAVGLDATGKIVVGAGNTGVLGVICLVFQNSIGDVVDVMTSGEIVDVALTAGTVYYAPAAGGALSTTAPAAGANLMRVGNTVEAWRLVVRCQIAQG